MKIKALLILAIVLVIGVSAFLVVKANEKMTSINCNKVSCTVSEINGLNKVKNSTDFQLADLIQCNVEKVILPTPANVKTVDEFQLYLRFINAEPVIVQNRDSKKLATVCENLRKKEDFSVEILMDKK